MSSGNYKKTKKVGVLLLTAFSLTLLLALSVTPTAYAGEYIEGGPDAVLEDGEIIEDDLFIGGDDVLVAGIVEGDLFAAGENVIVSGEVYGNVFAAGATVTVSGKVDGALLIAGYDLTLEDSASIGRNVYFGGFSFQTMAESMINRSIYGGGYQMILSGTVGRDITAGLGALKMAGPVSGDVNVEIGEPTDRPDDLFTYWSPGLPPIKILDPGYVVDENLVDGETNIKVVPIDTDVDIDVDTDFRIDPGFFIFQRMRRRIGEFIALMLVGLLALWLMKGTLLKAVEEVKSNAGMDTVWGILVYLLYIPVVLTLFLVLLMLTILISIFTLGNLAGEMMTVSSFLFFGSLAAFGMLAGLATKVVMGYLVGRWILDKTSKPSFENFWSHVAALAIGIALYEAIRFIPFIGWLLMIVVVVVGTGAFAVMFWDGLKKNTSITPEETEIIPE